MSGTPQIVTLNVSVTQAGTPSTLQQTGASVSQGGTTAPVGSLTSYATETLVTAALTPAQALTSLAWSAEVVTATTTAPHGWTDADTVLVDISGAVPAAYNGTVEATITGTDTFTYPLASNPGAETVPGTANLHSVAQIGAMATTYFAGLNPPAMNILELGEGTVVDGIAALSAWINTNLGQVYIWEVPREWNAVSEYVTLVTTWSGPGKKTYFFTTMALGDITNTAGVYTTPYTGQKSVFGQVEAPGIPSSEFSIASPFASALSLYPGSTNPATPLTYAPAYGVTPYPIPGNGNDFTELAGANVGWIGTGAAGGLSSTILFQGLMQDGNQFIFWYGADWVQINLQMDLANELINAAVPGNLAPIVYNQAGINRLQNRVVNTLNQAVGYGLANGQVKAYQLPAATFAQNYANGQYEGQIPVNAEPYGVYTQENPSNYKLGLYGGLGIILTPQNAFINIVANLNITNITVP